MMCKNFPLFLKQVYYTINYVSTHIRVFDFNILWNGNNSVVSIFIQTHSTEPLCPHQDVQWFSALQQHKVMVL